MDIRVPVKNPGRHRFSNLKRQRRTMRTIDIVDDAAKHLHWIITMMKASINATTIRRVPAFEEVFLGYFEFGERVQYCLWRK